MGAVLALLGMLAGGPTPVKGQAVGPDLAKVRAELANDSTPIAERATRALDTAAELDRLAQEARTVAERRARWAEAATLLEEFARTNPDADATPLVRFQSAVYLWAEGRSFADRVDTAPADEAARASASDRMDRAIALLRLAGVEPKPGDAAGTLAQNVRFRLAQALADRARLGRDGEPGRVEAEREAVGLLERSIADPKLRGFARLLRAELNNRLGHYNQAQIDVDEAEKAVPPPDPGALARARVAALIGRAQYAEARKAADAARADEATRGWLAIRVLLAQRRGATPGSDREALDAEVFGIAAGLRASPRPEAARALIEVAGAIDEPGETRPLDWWDTLAEGQLRLGNPARAGRLLAKGADLADAGPPDRVASARMKAGACLFEAEKFAEAEKQLARVADDPQAPGDLRARAGMLIALSRGRALSLKQPGAALDAYYRALEDQVRRFPDAPATGEARWLLGKVRRGEGRRDEAVALWSAVPRDHARWLDAQLAATDLLRAAVEEERISRDQRAIARKLEEARDLLARAERAATAGNEAVEIALRVALLELIPGVGKPGVALDACERILKGGARPDQHEQARLVRVVALARDGQLIEAERSARDEVRAASPASLLAPLRLLDRIASEADGDLNRRRLGLVYKVLAGRLTQGLGSIPERSRDEARLRVARSLVFAGDPMAARREIAAWGGPSEGFDDGQLRDLADMYFRLEAYPLAADAERLRTSKLPAGSPAWFDARYNLSLAHFRSGKAKEARQIIDATAILHPELGGGELRDKFTKLRQRLAQE
ncbi:hypothetical protein TA3x_003498 [Tundrisphaera sp. TA3]|uniref:hypothetical protein n=1 Tax=Tundrisphaera sp. TA3 TaxID=3435775 RepID=UPI003EBC7C0F